MRGHRPCASDTVFPSPSPEHADEPATLPRYPLTFGPTPIQPLKRLSDHLGGKVELYAKREDCNSGLAFGGNKTRKLEYLIPDALSSSVPTRSSRSAACSRIRRGKSRRSPPISA